MLAILIALAAAAPPLEWQDAIDNSDMMYSDKADVKYMPEVGNGYVATVVGSDLVFMAGVFNGQTPPLTPESSRADLPSPIQLKPRGVKKSEGGLNIREGIFYNRMTLDDGSTLEYRSYAHRTNRSLLVLEMQWWGDETEKTIEAHLNPPAATEAFLNPTVTTHGDITVWDGWTTMAEDNKTIIHVAAVFPAVGAYNVKFTNGSTACLIGVMRSSLDAADPVSAALSDYTSAMATTGTTLKTTHTNAWSQLWESGIEIDRVDVAQAVNTSLYFILSSIREDWHHSLSPGGLASSGYNGHTFWDCATWMYPTVLALFNDMARSLLQYRIDRIPGARENAQKYEKNWEGAKFPWESGFTGSEVCGPSYYAEYEIHIGGDISYASQQYYDMTGDDEWVKGGGYELVSSIADYYVSRATWSDSTTAHLENVTCPDEYHQGTDNVYTNYVAKMNLKLAQKFASISNNATNPKWEETADSLVLLFDESSQIHPEFAGYKGDTVKQADTILLGFPLQMNMTKSVRQNDLDYYKKRTTNSGPAMTWGMFAIGYLETGVTSKAEENFNKSFANVREPYKVWTETPTGGTVNFITGAGGFLQTVLFGYPGMRITSTGLDFTPLLPQHSTTITVRSLKYHNAELTLSYTAGTLSLEVLNGAQGIVLIDDNGVRHPVDNKVTLPTAPFTITHV